MVVSREVEGLKFVAECDDSGSFVARTIECAHCDRQIDPVSQADQLSLACPGCGLNRTFWSEAQMHVFIAENWNALRVDCAHPKLRAKQEAS
jgi:phage FluMu protein Com